MEIIIIILLTILNGIFAMSVTEECNGVVTNPFLGRTKMVNNTIGTVKRNLIEGVYI